MRILLSNDDGIFAPGIKAAKSALETLGEVFVVAPERERSGAGHGITVHKPLRPKKIAFSDGTYGWAVNGTPADCVKLAIEALLTEPPDIVISGINFGANLGTDVLYSGTVSAAIEGIISGIPSVAISLATFEHQNFQYAATFLRHIIPLLTRDKPESFLININIPPGKPVGVKITQLGNRRYVNMFHKRFDPRGRVYYWMAGEPEDSTPGKSSVDTDVDFEVIKNNFISVTPLQFDLTDFKAIGKLNQLISSNCYHG